MRIQISFVNKCFKTFLDQLYLKRSQVLSTEKKTLTLVLPFPRELSVQTKTENLRTENFRTFLR